MHVVALACLENKPNSLARKKELKRVARARACLRAPERSEGDLGCPRAWETRFARGNLQTRVPRESVMFGVFWVALGSPRGAPELS